MDCKWKGEEEWGDRYRDLKRVRKDRSKTFSGLREEKQGKKKLLQRYVVSSSHSYEGSCVEDAFKRSKGWKALGMWSEGTGWQWEHFVWAGVYITFLDGHCVSSRVTN